MRCMKIDGNIFIMSTPHLSKLQLFAKAGWLTLLLDGSGYYSTPGFPGIDSSGCLEKVPASRMEKHCSLIFFKLEVWATYYFEHGNCRVVTDGKFVQNANTRDRRDLPVKLLLSPAQIISEVLDPAVHSVCWLHGGIAWSVFTLAISTTFCATLTLSGWRETFNATPLSQ